MDGVASPTVHWSVEMGATMPRVRVRIGERAIPIDISPGQAGDLALALLVANAACSSEKYRPPEGTAIEPAPLPVLGARCAVHAGTNNLVLMAQILGDAEVRLSFTRDGASACADALHAGIKVVDDLAVSLPSALVPPLV